MSDSDYNEIEGFYDQLQNVIDQTPTKDILVLQEDWKAKVGNDAREHWHDICGPFYNDGKNERGLGLLEFATFNGFVLVNAFVHHKASRRWTSHSPSGQHYNQADYIPVRKCFRLGVNSAILRSFPEADIGSDHDLLIATFHLRLKRINKPKHTRLKLDLEQLKDPLCWKPPKLSRTDSLHLSPP